MSPFPKRVYFQVMLVSQGVDPSIYRWGLTRYSAEFFWWMAQTDASVSSCQRSMATLGLSPMDWKSGISLDISLMHLPLRSTGGAAIHPTPF